MRYVQYKIILLCGLFGFLGCEDAILDLENPTAPTDATFFQTEDQLEVALTGAYELVIWEPSAPWPQNLDNSTDLGFLRGNIGGLIPSAIGTISSTDGVVSSTYEHMYVGIQRTNNLLQNMEKAEDVTDPNRFAQIRGEALFLRAYYYHFLLELYGDVPFRTQVSTSLEGLELERTPKAEIADNLLSDLETVASLLPDTWDGANAGRATRGAALTLRSRIALYNENWSEAEASARAVMDMGMFSLHQDYESLFTAEGVRSEEVIFDMPFAEGFNTQRLPRVQGSRFGGWSQLVPSQQMVDSYECTDGLPIDESPLYDPASPYENRDPRLDASIVRPGATWTGVRFETHSDSVQTDVVSGGEVVGRTANLNATNTNAGPNRFTTFTGYLWKKFSDEPALMGQGNVDQSILNIILMRYAEVLLNYAEAKIEAGNIDQSVLDAMNDIKARAYGTTREDVNNYPAVTTLDQKELRRILRRDRKVELADEGFRLFDIRRWRIAEKVMNTPLYGSPANGWSLIGEELNFIPDIDEDGFIDYTGAPSMPRVETGNLMYREVEVRLFDPDRHYLWPIPQAEVDASVGAVKQNPGY